MLRLTRMLKPTPPKRIVCSHCGHDFVVGGRAMTLTCPSCYQPLTLEDVIVKTVRWGGRIETCGMLVVERRGQVFAKSVRSSLGIEIAGVLQADVRTNGPVIIRDRARFKGDCAAPRIHIEEGAIVEGGKFSIVPHALQQGVSPAPVLIGS